MKLRTWMRLVQLEAVLIQIGKSELDLEYLLLRSYFHAVLLFFFGLAKLLQKMTIFLQDIF